MQQLAERIAQMPGRTLEEELIEIFVSAPRDRNAEILIGYYGWNDGRQRTLTHIGKRFGITRERIRQICAKLTRKAKSTAAILAPVMDRSLALVQQRLPAAADALEAELRQCGWTAVGMSLEGLATGARLLGRRTDFRVVKIEPDRKKSPRLAVHADQVEVAPVVADVAKKDVYFHGLATAEQIERLVAAKYPGAVSPELVRQTLPLVAGFSWLDQRSGWFRIKGIGKHGLPKTIDKVLAVAGSVTVRQLRAAVGRNRRMWKEPPPEGVLLAFCHELPGVRVEGQRIFADPPRDWRKALTGVEWKLVSVLKKYGPVMERGEMEDICVSGGMNRFSFHAFVSWSPIIVQLGHSVYGLLGAEVPRRRSTLCWRRGAESRGAPRVGQPRLDRGRQDLVELPAVEGGQHLRGHHGAGGPEEGGPRPLHAGRPRRRADRRPGDQGRPRLGAGRLSSPARRPHRRSHPLDPRPPGADGRGLLGRGGIVPHPASLFRPNDPSRGKGWASLASMDSLMGTDCAVRPLVPGPRPPAPGPRPLLP